MKTNNKKVLSLPVSIIIITKNRPNILLHCLESLGKQTQKNDEIIIIDGSYDKKSYLMVKRFAKTTPSRVIHIIEKNPGFSLARNRGIDVSKNNWIAFIDDDCVAHKEWVNEIKKTALRTPFISAVIGESETYYPHNIYSLAARYHELCWKLPSISGNAVTDLEILDTKNIVFNKHFIKTNALRFDESKPYGRYWTNDDIDFGMQIWGNGGKAIYNSEMIVYHKDARTLKGFMKKIIDDSLSYSIYRKKWAAERTSLEKNKPHYSSSFLFSLICKKYFLSYFQMLCLGILLFIATQAIRCASLFAKIKFS